MKHKRNIRGFRPGLGLVEMLIALSISAMLLGSVAMALQGSLHMVEENQKIAQATQSGRVVLHRMMTEARRAIDVECTTGRLRVLPPPDGSGLAMTEYQFDSGTGTLWYRQTIGASQTSYPVLSPADGVRIRGFSVSYTPGQDSEGELCTKVLTAWLDLEVDGNAFAVTASMAPRRNQEW